MALLRAQAKRDPGHSARIGAASYAWAVVLAFNPIGCRLDSGARRHQVISRKTAPEAPTRVLLGTSDELAAQALVEATPPKVSTVASAL